MQAAKAEGSGSWVFIWLICTSAGCSLGPGRRRQWEERTGPCHSRSDVQTGLGGHSWEEQEVWPELEVTKRGPERGSEGRVLPLHFLIWLTTWILFLYFSHFLTPVMTSLLPPPCPPPHPTAFSSHLLAKHQKNNPPLLWCFSMYSRVSFPWRAELILIKVFNACANGRKSCPRDGKMAQLVKVLTAQAWGLGCGSSHKKPDMMAHDYNSRTGQEDPPGLLVS